jgi:predicted DCC family thiol-disulfide oxidoreductase YuxK
MGSAQAKFLEKAMNTVTAREIAWLVYDDECPVCRTYCRYARIRETVGELRLVDARQPGPLMDEITAAGLDIDQGMVLKFKDVVYYGADAIHMLSLLSTRSGVFNRVSFLLFGTRVGAQLLYPAGKAFRNVLLKVLGIGYIRNLDAQRAAGTPARTASQP